ncbi:MAG: hypothetical protein EXQ96_09540 [Alphaproteobacteria bacterium]|nr:hypothetical protein [Alphaproteobacteria bacterium]
MLGGRIRHTAAAAEAAARAIEPEHLEDFLSQGGTWFWETDAGLRFTLLTTPFAAVTGIAPETLLGQPFAAVVGADPDHGAAMAAGLPFTNLAAVVAGRRPVLLSGRPWHTADGRQGGYRGVGQLPPDAEATVADHSFRAAVQALGHELRGPIGGIIGLSELLLAGELPEDQWRHARMVRESCAALLAVANQLFDLTCRHSSASGLAVMLIDAAAMERQLAAELLRRADARPEVAASLEEALASAGEPVAVVVLASDLIRGDWRAAVRRLALAPRFADAALVLLDAQAEPGHADRARAAGYAAYLSKPVAPAVLLDAVAALAAERRGQTGEGTEADHALITRQMPSESARARGLETATPDAEAPISRAALLPLSAALGAAGLVDLVRCFGEDSRARLAQIGNAFAAGETAQVVQSPHDLRSTSGSLGATRVFAAADALLKRCRAGSCDAIGPPLAAIERHIQDALAAIESHAREAGAG